MKQYPISRDGCFYLVILTVLSVLAYWIWPWLVILPGILFLFILYFFRAYQPGKMIPAFKNHDLELNEKNYVGIRNDHLRIMVAQVTGFIARRIACWVNKGYDLTKGERFRLIKFGSCTEIFVPTNVEMMVSPGDKVRRGISVIGRVSVE